jgi:hypothetical protein
MTPVANLPPVWLLPAVNANLRRDVITSVQTTEKNETTLML